MCFILFITIIEFLYTPKQTIKKSLKKSVLSIYFVIYKWLIEFILLTLEF